MTRKTKLAQMQVLARLALDARLSDVRVAARSRDDSLARLADLDKPPGAADLPLVAAAEVTLRYEMWADQRRGDLNLVLARQTADWLEKREVAARAFGQAQAIDGLAKRG